jgi:hypothetical protein
MLANESEGRPSSDTRGDGLLSEDRSEIRIVADDERSWFERLPEAAKLRFAERRNKKWTDEETRELVLADPGTTDYYELAEKLGRSPGALRIRRSHMIHLLRDEYDYVAKAEAYLADQKAHHKVADIGQVYRIIKELGWFEIPVSQQFERARHLRQPSGSWRGDGSSAVLRERKARAADMRDRLAELRREVPRDPS